MKVVISRCYLVQVVDDDGNELACEYTFEDRKGAQETGRQLKERVRQEQMWRQ